MKFLSFILLICLLIPIEGIGQDSSDRVAQIVERAAYYEIDFKKIPGISIGLFYEDSTYFFNYGEKVKGVDQLPDSETVYEISSVSKVITATLFQLLAADKYLDLNHPIGKYIEGVEMRIDGEPMRIEHLLNHTAGLPKQPFNFGVREKDPSNPYAYYSRTDLLDFLQQYRPLEKPGTKYQYSHVGYAILEWIAENATGKSYEDLLSTYFFKPLNMTSTAVELNENLLSRMAQGYDLTHDPVDPWSFMTYGASLGLKSTPADLLLFAKGMLNEKLPYHFFLQEMIKNPVNTQSDRVKAGQAWHLAETRKKFPPLVLHSGVSDGYQTYLAIIPEKKAAIVVMSNSEHSQKGLGGYILQLLFHNFKDKERTIK